MFTLRQKLDVKFCMLHEKKLSTNLEFALGSRTRQAMYIKRKNEENLSNHCRSGKSVSFTYSESVFVALVIQGAKHMHLITSVVICCLSGSTIFFQIIS
jgi:hypothetical protein